MSGGAPASAGPTTDLQPAQGAGDRRKDLKSSAPWEACMSMHNLVGTTALHGLAVTPGVCGLALTSRLRAASLCVASEHTYVCSHIFPSEERRRGLAGGISGHPFSSAGTPPPPRTV